MSNLQEHRKKASDLSLGLSDQLIYHKAIALLQKFAKGSRHLDFGSGRGLFLQELSHYKADYELSAADLMPKPQDITSPCQWHEADLNATLPFGADSFESVTALEIIEHLENPRFVMRELYRVMQPGACLVMSTPNNESWRSILSFLVRGHFVAFTESSYPAHITALNRLDLLRAGKEAGFQFVAWDYIGKGCLPGITRLSWQRVSFGLLQGLRYSDNLFIVLRK